MADACAEDEWLEFTRIEGTKRYALVQRSAIAAILSEGATGSMILLRGGGSFLVRESFDEVRCAVDHLELVEAT